MQAAARAAGSFIEFTHASTACRSPIEACAVSYTHLTLATNREV